MAERSPEKLPPEAVSSGTSPAQAVDVFTLHHAVLSRWDGGRALGAAHSSASAALTHGHDRWLGGLAGLSSLGGGFGPAAWNMATQLVAEPTLLTRLGADLRSLQVGELADLVQLILEEEEGQGDIAELEAAISVETARARNAASSKGSAGKAQAPKAKAAGAAAKGKTAATSARRAPLHLQNKLKELRRILAEVRRADAAGVSTPQQAGDLGGNGPQQAIANADGRVAEALVSSALIGDSGARGEGRAQGFSANPPAGQGLGAPRAAGIADGQVGFSVPSFAASALSASQRVAAAGRQRSLMRAAWTSPFSSVAQAQTSAAAPKALRMAEQAADLSLLDLPAAELALGDAAEPVSAGAPLRASGGSTAAAQSGSPASAPSRAAAASSFAPATAQAQSFAALRQQWVAQQAAQLQGPSRAPQAPAPIRQGSTPLRQGSAPAQQSSAEGVAEFAAASAPSVRPGALPGQAGPRAFAGMAAAVAHARAHLQRLDRGMANLAVHSSSAADRSTLGQAQGQAQAGGSADRSLSQAVEAGLAQAGQSQSRSTQADSAVGAAVARRFAARAVAGVASLDSTSAGLGDLGVRQERASAPLQRWQAWSEQAAAAFGGAAAGRAYRGALASGGEDREILGLAEEIQAPAEARIAADEGAATRQVRGEARGSAAAPASRGAAAASAKARAVAQAPQPGANGTGTQLPSWIAPKTHGAALAAAEGRRSAGEAFAAGSAVGPRAIAEVGTVSAPGMGSALGSEGAPQGRLLERMAQHWAKATGGVPGLAAVAMAGLAERFAARSLLGLEPATAGQKAGIARFGAVAAAAIDAGREAPGEWLVPGAESEAAAVGDVQASGSRGVAGELGGGQGGAARRSAARAPAALAAVAAVERAQRQAVASLRAVASAGQRGPSVVQSVGGLAELGVLAAAPGGQADALTPWLEKRLRTTSAVSKAAAGDGAGELLSLGDEGAVEAAAGDSAPRAGAREVARQSSPRPSAEAGTRAPRAAASAGRSGAQGIARSASAAVDSLTPQALRTILQALGESTAPAERDVASAFAAKWLGRADVAGKVLRRMAADATPAGELLAMRDTAGSAATVADAPVSAIGRTVQTAASRQAAAPSRAAGVAAAPVAASVDGDQVVLSGFAALAALASGDFGQRPGQRPMQTPDVERTMLAPAAEAPGEASQVGGESQASAAGNRGAAAVKSAAAKADLRKIAAVKLHEFAPLGLKRGRNLLGQQRRSSWLHTTPRGQVASARSLSRLAGSRVGYGAAALGAGDLVGLVQGDAEMYFGDGAPSPSAVRGADRLSQAVMARRGHTHRAAPSAAPMAAFEGEQVLPSEFRAGGDTAAAMQASLAASGRSGGATAGLKATQAAAMTRVLSVTSAPAANVLPLVAPAAQAVVAAAAAKPLSESIVTSGADPTVGMPLAGVGGHKAGKAGGGAEKERAAAEEHGSNVQDLEALAMKVARSVMVRIKRERERRGLHV